MSKLARKDILNLSVAELPDAITLTGAQKAELDRRLDAYHQDPTAGAPWPVVRDRIAKRK